MDTVLGAAKRLGLPDDALGAAEDSELLTVVGAELRFRHPLVRSAVYADATFHRRRAAHLAIADHLGAHTDRATWHRAVAATAPDERLADAVERSADAARRRGGEAAAVSVLRRAARLSESADGRRRRLVAAAFVALDSGQPDVARTLVDEVMADPVPGGHAGAAQRHHRAVQRRPGRGPRAPAAVCRAAGRDRPGGSRVDVHPGVVGRVPRGRPVRRERWWTV